MNMYACQYISKNKAYSIYIYIYIYICRVTYKKTACIWGLQFVCLFFLKNIARIKFSSLK